MAVTSVITCPECEKKFKGRDELQGKKIRCPGCGHAFIVQKMAQDKVDSEATAAPPKPAAKKAAKAKAPTAAPAPATAKKGGAGDDLDEDGNPYGVTNLDLAPRCPNCTEKLPSAEALICRYCGYNTQTRILGKTVKTVAHTGGERFKWLLPGLICALVMFLLYLGALFYSLQVPGLIDHSSWVAMFDSEAVRLWITMILLGLIWGIGQWTHKRLIFHPTPPEKIKE